MVKFQLIWVKNRANRRRCIGIRFVLRTLAIMHSAEVDTDLNRDSVVKLCGEKGGEKTAQ